jgi:ketosteroid isomerase-like protein
VTADAVATASAAHPNAARIRALFAAFRNADLATITATIPEDAVWHFPGRKGKLAGAHRGRQAILQFLMSVPQLTNGTFHLELEDVLANDANAVAFFRGSGTRDGKTLDNPTCLRLRIVDGQVVEVWEFVWDLFAVDEFWA